MSAGNQLSRYLREERLPCLYTDDIYVKAAQIFALLRRERQGDNDDGALSAATRRRHGERPIAVDSASKKRQLPHFDSAADKFLAYDLAYVTLEYQRVLEDLIADVGLLAIYPDLLDVEALALVMLGDYQRRKFQPRQRSTAAVTKPPTEVEVQTATAVATSLTAAAAVATAAVEGAATAGAHEDATAVANAVESCSLRLNAALARRRIRCNARTVEDMLPGGAGPPQGRGMRSARQPSWVWINTAAAASKRDVIDRLTEDGYAIVTSIDDLQGRTILLDQSQDDVIAFSPDAKDDMRSHNLVRCRQLVIQDYTTCIGSRALKAAVCPTADVIHIDGGSGAATAHLASVLREISFTGSILRFSTADDAGCQASAERLLRELGVTNVQLFSERFDSLQSDDPRLKYARTALVAGGCSGSAIANPIDFLVTDGGDLNILESFAAGEKSKGAGPVKECAGRNQILLRQVMSVPNIKTVVYLTRSVHSIENEQVVTKALDLVNANLPPKKAYKLQSYSGQASLSSQAAFSHQVAQQQQQQQQQPHRMAQQQRQVSSANSVEPAESPYFKLAPSAQRSGCFIALLTREIDEPPPKRTNKDKLARALAAIGGIGTAADAGARASAAGAEKAAAAESADTQSQAITGAKRKQRKTKVAFGRLASATRSRKKK